MSKSYPRVCGQKLIKSAKNAVIALWRNYYGQWVDVLVCEQAEGLLGKGSSNLSGLILPIEERILTTRRGLWDHNIFEI